MDKFEIFPDQDNESKVNQEIYTTMDIWETFPVAG